MVVIQEAHRVSGGAGDGNAVGIGGFIIAEESVVTGVNGRTGVMRCAAPNGVVVGETGVAVCALEIDIQFEMIVEKGRSQ